MPAAKRKPVQNNAATTGDAAVGGATGKGFKPGKSGNPGGRPRGLARKVREVLGDDDGETLARFWGGVLSGVLISNVPEIQPDGTTVERRVVEKVAMSDRIAVSKLLAERGWGKAPEYAPIEDDDPLDLADRQTAVVAESFEARMDELAARRAAKAG